MSSLRNSRVLFMVLVFSFRSSFAADHFVSPAGSNIAPFTSWDTAANNIQDAIDAASAGETVWVTNGVYTSGGKVMAGDLMNRVAVYKALTLRSVNGPLATTIQGVWDPVTTNGPLAVRCAWLTNGAALNGFTIRGGATRSVGDLVTLQSGGGIWAISSTNTTVVNCVICTNSATYSGGGSYRALIRNSRLLGNSSKWGGGMERSWLVNCLVLGNSASLFGGGADGGNLTNCTVTGNYAGSFGGGIYGSSYVANSIVYGNPTPSDSNWGGSIFYYSCSVPGPLPGISNLSINPEILDEGRIATTSPCRGAGSSASASGTDVDGEPWAIPPSMGCDEVWEAGLTGPITVGLFSFYTNVPLGGSIFLNASVRGLVSRVGWSFGDGPELTNSSPLIMTHSWTNLGDYTVTFAAYNTDHPTGVSTNIMIHIVPVVPPVLTAVSYNGSNFALTCSSQPGLMYELDYSTNLTPPIVWQPRITLFGGGTIHYTDFQATNSMRFYRVWLP